MPTTLPASGRRGADHRAAGVDLHGPPPPVRSVALVLVLVLDDDVRTTTVAGSVVVPVPRVPPHPATINPAAIASATS